MTNDANNSTNQTDVPSDVGSRKGSPLFLDKYALKPLGASSLYEALLEFRGKLEDQGMTGCSNIVEGGMVIYATKDEAEKVARALRLCGMNADVLLPRGEDDVLERSREVRSLIASIR